VFRTQKAHFLAHFSCISLEFDFMSDKDIQHGILVINADDFGRDKENTDRIRDCKLAGTVSSASAMVFMEDSQRAANIAKELDLDTGLHLNLTAPFTCQNVSPKLEDHHQRIMAYLRRSRFAQVLYHPGLSQSFKYTVASQIDE